MNYNEYPEEIFFSPEENPLSVQERLGRAYDLGKKHGIEPPASATWILEALEKGSINKATAIGQAVALGKKIAQAGTGDWRNLTAAIAAGEPIDWEKLDGRKVRMSCEMTSIEATLSRDDEFLPSGTIAWSLSNDNDANHLWGFFNDAWNGRYGWTLWLDGEIPMRKQTADELPFGTVFKSTNGWECLVIGNGKVQFLDQKHLPYNVGTGAEYEVSEVLGMYGQKESE